MFSFPTGVAVPAELDALFEFAEANGGEVSGLFEFDTDGSDSALAWFDKDPVPARDFAVFGRGPDGSQYAFWLHAGSDTSTAPVVLLDSECRGSCVIADNVREFLRLLAIGYEEPGRYPTLEPEDRASAAKLRKWLKAQYKLVPPKTGAELVATAQARHPDLMAWITDWQNNRLGAAIAFRSPAAMELTAKQRQHVAWIIEGPNADDYDMDTHDQQRAQALAALSTPEELFLFASESHAALEPAEWRWIVQHPLCDHGTALLVFWRNSPVRYYSDEPCEYESERERSELVRQIAARCAAGTWPFARVRFDPAAFKGRSFLDGYEPDELARVPAHMLTPTPGEPVPPLVAEDFAWADE